MVCTRAKNSPQTSSITLTLLNCKLHTQQGTADLNIATIYIYVYINKDEIQFSFGTRGQQLHSCIYIPFHNSIGILLQLLNASFWKVYFQHPSQTALKNDLYKQHKTHLEQKAPSNHLSDGKIRSVFASFLCRKHEKVSEKLAKPFWHYKN